MIQFLLAVVMVLGLARAADDVAMPEHGLNLGNFLEAEQEGKWSNGRLLQEDDFPRIKQAGFDFVRVPIRWSGHVGAAPDFAIDPVFLARIDWVVAQAEKNGLTAILDYHNDDALCKNADANADRFVATWKQIAVHFKDAPTTILFELFNEPFKMSAEQWNGIAARALVEIRKTNPARTVVVGPVHWNSIDLLPKLVLPEDDHHLLVTVHNYDPFHFTHQGASWAEGSDAWLGTTWEGTDAEKKAITDKFDQAAAWGAAHHRPMYLGEFGAFGKSPIEGRARWTAFVARTAEARGMSWSYWEYCSGFGVYDPVAKQWREPLLKALLPK